MALTGKLALHPTEWTPAVLDDLMPVLVGYSDTYDMIVDSFAGRGVRLAGRADQLGKTFLGIDIETWQESDPRVIEGDARDPLLYPSGDRWVLVTSPPYTNRCSTDYVNGPLPTTKLAGRRFYGTSLGRALHPDNIARLAKPGSPEFYAAVGAAMKVWTCPLALVNVDEPMAALTQAQLVAAGFEVVDVREVVTPRLGGVTGSGKRAPHEVVIVGLR